MLGFVLHRNAFELFCRLVQQHKHVLPIVLDIDQTLVDAIPDRVRRPVVRPHMETFLCGLEKLGFEVHLWTQAVREHAEKCVYEILRATSHSTRSVLSTDRLIPRSDHGFVTNKNLDDKRFAYSAVRDRLGHHPLTVIIDDQLVWSSLCLRNVVRARSFSVESPEWRSDDYLREVLTVLGDAKWEFSRRFRCFEAIFDDLLAKKCSTDEEYEAWLTADQGILRKFQLPMDEMPVLPDIVRGLLEHAAGSA